MHFATVVRTVDRLPLWIRAVGWLLVLANVMGSVTFLVSAAATIPGLGASAPEQQAATMIAARQIGQAVVLAFALLYRDVRVLQAVFAMVAIEVAAFVYLGMIASGRVARYLPRA